MVITVGLVFILLISLLLAYYIIRSCRNVATKAKEGFFTADDEVISCDDAAMKLAESYFLETPALNQNKFKMKGNTIKYKGHNKCAIEYTKISTINNGINGKGYHTFTYNKDSNGWKVKSAAAISPIVYLQM